MRQPVVPQPPKIGVDIPWVVSWSEEAPAGAGPCPTVDGQVAALQAWKPGSGKPLNARNHLRRQRDSVRAMLCPMCGEPTPDNDRWSRTGRFVAAGVLRARGLAAALPADLDDDRVLLDCGSIAPLHFRCTPAFERALPPSLLTDPDLKGFPPSWVVVPLYVEARQPVTGKAIAAVSFLQMVGITNDRDADWQSRLPQV